MAETRRSTEDRQAELIDAALRIIATRGITALSTRALAAEVGLSTGAIFRHFATLDALLDGVVERVEAVLAATYPSDELPPLARLDAFVEARSTAVGNQLGILRLMLSEQFLLALPTQGSARLEACVQRSRAFVLACLREGQACGAVRSDVSAEALVPVVMGTVQMLALSGAGVRQRVVEGRRVREGLSTLLRPPQGPGGSEGG